MDSYLRKLKGHLFVRFYQHSLASYQSYLSFLPHLSLLQASGSVYVLAPTLFGVAAAIEDFLGMQVLGSTQNLWNQTLEVGPSNLVQ